MSVAVAGGTEDRFERFSLIPWWDQDRLRRARVLVVGAGALGNEILKNLALLGVGRIAVVDLDSVERSNLPRAVLLRERDIGRPKSEAVAAALHDLHPDTRVFPIRADVIHGVGMGLFRWADVVLGAVDNREARLAIGRFCQLVGRPWIDGGIEVLAGIARVFLPGDGPCYECTLSEEDWKILANRRACTLLPRDAAPEPRVPTTPTTAAIVAGVQCAEALKILHGRPGLAGEGFHFDGHQYDAYRVRYRRDPECYGHEPLPDIRTLPLGAADATAAGIAAAAEPFLGSGAEIEAGRELVSGFRCPSCGADGERYGSLDSFSAGDATCPRCRGAMTPSLYHRFADAPAQGRSLLDLGIPRWDILRARSGGREVALELGGDRPIVLGGEA